MKELHPSLASSKKKPPHIEPVGQSKALDVQPMISSKSNPAFRDFNDSMQVSGDFSKTFEEERKSKESNNDRISDDEHSDLSQTKRDSDDEKRIEKLVK